MAEQQQERKDFDDTVKADLLVNNLIYKQPKSLSLAVNRTMKRQYFQRSAYTDSDTAIIDWNTGSDYVKACNSYLVFSLALTGTTPVGEFASGFAMNVLNNVTIRSRSGTELDRLERANLYAKNNIRHNYGADWISKYGTMMGLDGGTTLLSATAVKFVIPLSVVSGFFRPTLGQLLIPPQLASGLHMEIQFADYRQAVKQTSGTITGYTITDLSIMADCVTLSDSTQKSLNMESASSGLEYTYPRVHTSTTNITGTQINIQCRKAVSQANMAVTTVLDQATTLSVTQDSFKGYAWDVDSWQYRLGSLYFPHQQITSANDGKESFFHAQSVYDKPRHAHSENAVGMSDFLSGGYGVMTASLEKDQSLNLSGLPINNSRQLELQATMGGSDDYEVVLFLEYSSVARAFIDNCSTSI